MNPFRALLDDSKPYPPARLTGPIRTRAAARIRYGEIVAEVRCCGDGDELGCLLRAIADELAQYEDELPALWEGDGFDFAGLRREIENTFHKISGESLNWRTVRL